MRSPYYRSSDIPALDQQHTMDLTAPILRILDDTLGLQGRALDFDRSTRLLGALPELDSMAVLALITRLEENFGMSFYDEDLDGSAFATVGSLIDLTAETLAQQGQ